MSQRPFPDASFLVSLCGFGLPGKKPLSGILMPLLCRSGLPVVAPCRKPIIHLFSVNPTEALNEVLRLADKGLLLLDPRLALLDTTDRGLRLLGLSRLLSDPRGPELHRDSKGVLHRGKLSVRQCHPPPGFLPDFGAGGARHENARAEQRGSALSDPGI